MKIVLVYLNRDTNISMGAGYIGTIIFNAGHNLTFIDTVYETVDSTVSKVLNGNFDIVLLSATSLFYKEAIQIAIAIKVKSNVKILLGGIHATIAKGTILKDCHHIDYLCVGEGEDFILEFLQKYGTNSLYGISNLGYRDKDGTIIINPLRNCTNLKTLPIFKYDLFQPQSIVINPPYAPLPGFCYVFSTRGCPYSCSYCCNSYFLSLYKKDFLRKRNIDDVILELKYLKTNFNAQFFYFGDEMILFDKSYVSELFNRIKNEIGNHYGCMTRVENITPEVIKLFKDTGCGYVGIGIECGDEEFRKKFLNRHMSNKQIIEAFKSLRTIDGIILTSFNMKGYPVSYDNELTIKTNELNNIIKPNIVQTTVFFPFLGTKLHAYCIENNLIDPNKLNSVTNVFSTSVLKEIS